MFKYKYVITMLAMVCINLFLFYLYTNKVLAIYFLLLGAALMLFKALIIRIHGENLLDQYQQWLAELSMLSALGGWAFSSQHLFESVLLLVGSVICVIAFIFIALCKEMSENENK